MFVLSVAFTLRLSILGLVHFRVKSFHFNDFNSVVLNSENFKVARIWRESFRWEIDQHGPRRARKLKWLKWGVTSARNNKAQQFWFRFSVIKFWRFGPVLSVKKDHGKENGWKYGKTIVIIGWLTIPLSRLTQHWTYFSEEALDLDVLAADTIYKSARFYCVSTSLFLKRLLRLLPQHCNHPHLKFRTSK